MRRTTVRLAPVLALALASCAGDSEPTYAPRDAALRALPLYFYPSADSTRAPRALVFFFGNDVGFWTPHRELAHRLQEDGFSVVGMDIRPVFSRLPRAAAPRDSAFAAEMGRVLAAVRVELGAGPDAVPLILAGHSLGAETAIWTAAHVPAPGLAAVLALGPGSRSHLDVTVADLANLSEPEGPGSFSVAATIGAIPAGVRIALVRGDGDKYRSADSALMSAGGARLSRFVVPFASHSLKRMIVTGPAVSRALDWALARP
jgi:pimeloyl-ACP methyl ester carboxylesterase